MPVVTGELIDMYIDEGTTMGKVDIEGELVRVPLILLMDAHIGDRIVVDADVAVGLADDGGGTSESLVELITDNEADQ